MKGTDRQRQARPRGEWPNKNQLPRGLNQQDCIVHPTLAHSLALLGPSHPIPSHPSVTGHQPSQSIIYLAPPCSSPVCPDLCPLDASCPATHFAANLRVDCTGIGGSPTADSAYPIQHAQAQDLPRPSIASPQASTQHPAHHLQRQQGVLGQPAIDLTTGDGPWLQRIPRHRQTLLGDGVAGVAALS